MLTGVQLPDAWQRLFNALGRKLGLVKYEPPAACARRAVKEES